MCAQGGKGQGIKVFIQKKEKNRFGIRLGHLGDGAVDNLEVVGEDCNHVRVLGVVPMAGNRGMDRTAER